MIEVEYVDRRIDADVEVRFRYATGELIEDVSRVIMNDPATWNGALTIAGLPFDVMLTEVEVVPQFEGDVLKVRGCLRPKGSTT